MKLFELAPRNGGDGEFRDGKWAPLYKLALLCVKTDPETMEDLRIHMGLQKGNLDNPMEWMRNGERGATDTFWVHEFDEVDHAFDGDDLDEAIDWMYGAVDAVCEKIVDWYNNSWNHAPGFKKPKIEVSSAEDLHDDLFKIAIQDIAPRFFIRAIDAKKERKAAQDAKDETARAGHRANISELVDFAKRYYNKGWQLTLNYLHDNQKIALQKTISPRKRGAISELNEWHDALGLPKDFNFLTIRSAEELERLCKEKDTHFVRTAMENLVSIAYDMTAIMGDRARKRLGAIGITKTKDDARIAKQFISAIEHGMSDEIYKALKK